MEPQPAPAHRGDEDQSEYSLDAARAVLGHADPKMPTRYAAHDLKAASEVMGKIG